MKTIEERLTQSVEILRKIKSVGINTDFEGVKNVRKKLNDFVRTGEPFHGKIYIEEYKFHIKLDLNNKENKHCSATIKKN